MAIKHYLRLRSFHILKTRKAFANGLYKSAFRCLLWFNLQLTWTYIEEREEIIQIVEIIFTLFGIPFFFFKFLQLRS